MPVLPVIGGAIVGGAFAALVRRRQGPFLLAAILAAIAIVHPLFALVAGEDLLHQAVGAGAFLALAALGLRAGTTFLALAIVAHGGWDALLIATGGAVPEWYSASCIGFDLALGAVVLLRRRT
ncbi:hypothetical protein BCF33_2230 [Hasllibacter halocynthiae]|uniref:Uncharacterized protein n=1 Tax=Hasllibacter halocynthiae TaxID=595589 RepID=A0A2T0X331_9RHOB|nr:hypothetical protein [Hasllibacter halocynthiae]PRY93362.1 hypothetical protein BCF33_2230 [Hasllibacter halocynthiae]